MPFDPLNNRPLDLPSDFLRLHPRRRSLCRHRHDPLRNEHRLNDPCHQRALQANDVPRRQFVGAAVREGRRGVEAAGFRAEDWGQGEAEVAASDERC